MNTAPWPLSAGAFNASVRAGLLSSKTLAKADFFTGKLYLRSFWKECVRVCCRRLNLSKLLHIFFPNAAYTSVTAADIQYLEMCKHTNKHSKHTHTVQVFRPSCCVGLL